MITEKQCGVVLVRHVEPTLVCTRPAGHAGPHESLSGDRWGDAAPPAEPPVTKLVIGNSVYTGTPEAIEHARKSLAETARTKAEIEQLETLAQAVTDADEDGWQPQPDGSLRRAAVEWKPSEAQLAALHRLVDIAKRRSGQSERCADFLLAWWNAGEQGGFDLVHLWNVDAAIARDMCLVFLMVARGGSVIGYPDGNPRLPDLRRDIEEIVEIWRPEPEEKARRKRR